MTAHEFVLNYQKENELAFKMFLPISAQGIMVIEDMLNKFKNK